MVYRLFMVLTALLPLLAAAAEQGQRRFDDGRLRVHLHPRTPDQIAAFYEARGFPRAMIARLRAQCFITTTVRNLGDDIVWLEPARWEFRTADGRRIERLDRGYWKTQWAAMDAPLPARSTFRWTQLPESLDLRPGEGEGGNLILPRPAGRFSLIARFATGADRSGPAITVRFNDLRCAGPPSRSAPRGRK